MRRALALLLLTACSAVPTPATEPAAVREPPLSPRAPKAAPRAAERPELRPHAEAVTKKWPPKQPSRIATDWCTDAVSALHEGACYVLPEAPTATLLIYLHGIVPPQKQSAQKTTYQAIVARASRRAGAAALMPRGQRGLAPKGSDGWWGWPTSHELYRLHAKALTEKIAADRAALEAATGIAFTKVYIAGSSSGAWFSAALALYGGMPADGFGAMSGGALWDADELDRLPPKPFYIGYGTHDSVGPGARGLAQRLKSAGWPVRIAAHPVGHGAQDIYLEEAFAFWAEH